MRHRTILVAVLVALLCSVCSAKDKVWQTGTLEQITSDAAEHTVGTMNNGHAILKSRSVTTTHYVIRTLQYVYQADRGTNTGEKSLDVTVKGQVTFAVDNGTLYLKDDQGKEHKLQVITKSLP